MYDTMFESSKKNARTRGGTMKLACVLLLRSLKNSCALVRMKMMYRVWFAGHAYYLLMMRSNLLMFFWFLTSVVLVFSFLG